MTGSDHYREAERIMSDVQTVLEQIDDDAALPGLALGLQAAQVHATLALAYFQEAAFS